MSFFTVSCSLRYAASIRSGMSRGMLPCSRLSTVIFVPPGSTVLPRHRMRT